MLRIPRSVRVFVATRAVHAAVRIDGLVRRVRQETKQDPFSGDLFCFFSGRRTRATLLVWDRNGFWTITKRLERGRFERFDSRASWIEIEREELVMLLSGIDTKTARFRRRFQREVRISSRDAGDRSERTAQ